MSRIGRFLRRSAAYFRVRSMEIELEGKLERLRYTQDPAARIRQHAHIKQLRRRLSQARGQYLAFFPPGERMTWRNA